MLISKEKVSRNEVWHKIVVNEAREGGLRPVAKIIVGSKSEVIPTPYAIRA